MGSSQAEAGLEQHGEARARAGGELREPLAAAVAASYARSQVACYPLGAESFPEVIHGLADAAWLAVDLASHGLGELLIDGGHAMRRFHAGWVVAAYPWAEGQALHYAAEAQGSDG